MRSIFFFIFIAAVITGNGQNSGGHSVRGIEFPERESSKLINYTYTVISTMNHTWCYDIYKEKKMFIHQASIPGMHGNKGFKSKSDAEKVARLVIEKLKNGEMPPSVTTDEMKKLNVL